MIICPNCKKELTKKEKRYVCLNNHSFDISKEGYVNLLLPNKKNALLPGDNLQMVEAREIFLNKGYYQKLRDELFELSLKYKNKKSTLLDVGCGTGYYSTYIKQKRNFKDDLICVDISKFAAKKAAKKDKNAIVLVASIFDLPLDNNSIDLIFNIFSPKVDREYSRVLKDDGYLFEVMPGVEHMLEMKNILYDNVRLNSVEYKYDNFNLIEVKKIKDKILIDNNEDIKSLLSMTPYRYKTSEENIKKLDNIEKLELTINFEIVVWKKK